MDSIFPCREPPPSSCGLACVQPCLIPCFLKLFELLGAFNFLLQQRGYFHLIFPCFGVAWKALDCTIPSLFFFTRAQLLSLSICARFPYCSPSSSWSFIASFLAEFHCHGSKAATTATTTSHRESPILGSG
ncbi:hypothetical protein O6P43_023984 [Quillaja saponaria]|uniref:Uncharacterized protein n=1 Tax=Quillaja saponaria TaxID=32244 RepID=A0AAD7PJC7_QUISA|nr:hypothetical protein O6P43_023984 [Quillaja saponaria]